MAFKKKQKTNFEDQIAQAARLDSIHHSFMYFCKMETKRQLKIASLLYRELSAIFQYEFKALASGALVTVTKVTVSPDLSSAKVYLSIFAKNDKEKIVEVYRQRSREIRGLLGNKVRHQLRIIPELYFYLDDSLDYIEKIDHLLKGE